MVRRVLMNPRYAALVVHRGKVIGSGDWKPLIDKDTHRGIVAYLSDPSRTTKVGFERKYQGSGVYRCGVCDTPLISYLSSGRSPHRAYVCPNRSHVRRQGAALDDYVSEIVVRRLSKPDARQLLDTPDIDVARLHDQRAALQARLDELAGLFAEGSINGSQLKRGTAELSNALDTLAAELAAVTQGNPLAGFLVIGQRVVQLKKRWEALSPDLRGKIVDQLLVVTVNKSPRGLRRFDPEYINIDWRGQ